MRSPQRASPLATAFATFAAKKGYLVGKDLKSLDEVIASTIYVFIKDAARIEFNKYGDKIITVSGANQRLYEIANILYKFNL